MVFFLPIKNCYAISGYSGLNIMTPFFFSSEELKNGAANEEVKVNYSSYRVGYTAENGIYLGLIYEINNSTTEDNEYDHFSSGLSLGGARNGWYFTTHYFLNSKVEFPPNESTDRNKSNYGFSTGYSLQLDYNINLGLELNYRFHKYEKADGEEYSTSKFYPLLLLGTTF